MDQQTIEAELSYAYLHAVAAKAGASCMPTTRSLDNLGIDAVLNIRRRFPGAKFTDVTVNIQLKATVKPPRPNKGRRSYFLEDIDEYNRLRLPSSTTHRVLGVLFLPKDPSDWLGVTSEVLALRNSAYWVSLLGAPASANKTGRTVYLPEDQMLSPEGLVGLFSQVARKEQMNYVP